MLALVLGPLFIVGVVVTFIVAKNARRASVVPARVPQPHDPGDAVAA